MKKDEAKQLLKQVIDSLKLTKKEYDVLVLCLEVLGNEEKKDA